MNTYKYIHTYFSRYSMAVIHLLNCEGSLSWPHLWGYLSAHRALWTPKHPQWMEQKLLKEPAQNMKEVRKPICVPSAKFCCYLGWSQSCTLEEAPRCVTAVGCAVSPAVFPAVPWPLVCWKHLLPCGFLCSFWSKVVPWIFESLSLSYWYLCYKEAEKGGGGWKDQLCCIWEWFVSPE